MRAKKWITNNLGLKILSLILAIMTWFYVSNELAKIKSEEEEAIFSMLHYEVISKALPIKLTIIGEAREGYKINEGGITLDPENCVVIGPDNILNNVSLARTIPIDVSEYTQDINKQISLAPIAKGISLKGNFVNVYIPIVKIDETGEATEQE
jgi:YbbR domain-containing protein